MAVIARFERLLQGFAPRDDVAGLVEGDLPSAERLAALLASVDTHGDLPEASRLPRIRPVLLALSARAAGADEVDPDLQLAAELLHAALTLHDAALGQPGGRRRRLARRVIRRGGAWLGANRVMLRSLELVRHLPEAGILDDLMDTLSAFADVQDLAEGLLDGGLPDASLWDEHADGHTGALFSFCCRAGGQIAGRGPGDVAALGRYGRHLGRMWHVAEDVCLLRGPDAGEHLAGRALVGRPMLPVAIGILREPTLGPVWRSLVDGDSAAADRVLDGLRRTRAIQGSRAVVVREGWQAQQALQRFEGTPYRQGLERLVSGLGGAPFSDAG